MTKTTTLAALPAGWETVLLAAMRPSRQVSGLVKSTKELALLQMEGLPIPIKFKLLPMGPASLEVEKRAKAAAKSGLLLLEEEAPLAPGYSPRKVFRITDRGQAFVESDLKRAITDDQEGARIQQVLRTAPIRHGFHRDGKALVAHLHAILHLDDEEEHAAAYVSTVEGARNAFGQAQEWNLRSRLNMSAAAALDLTVQVLEAVGTPDEWDSDAGKRFTLWNAERVLDLTNQMGALAGQAVDAAPLAQEFDARTFALENLCSTYGYLELPDDEDIAAIMGEVANESPVDYE